MSNSKFSKQNKTICLIEHNIIPAQPQMRHQCPNVDDMVSNSTHVYTNKISMWCILFFFLLLLFYIYIQKADGSHKVWKKTTTKK